MIHHGENISAGTTYPADVCIIGSGPAGITLAWYLLAQGLSVVIAEAGLDQGGSGNNRNELLYSGISSGEFDNVESDFLSRPSSSSESTPWERECVYGGTSTHWGGTCRPLDAGVFAGRPGFPAWPISRADLDPAYAEACKFMKLYGPYFHGEDPATAGYNFTAPFWSDTLGPDNYQPLDLEGFEEAMYQIITSSVKKFQTRTVDGMTIGESPAQVILNASLVGVHDANGTVQRVELANFDSQRGTITRFTVQANVFVLACGAVENARQLLLAGLGGSEVGSFLTGHPIPYGSQGVSAYFGNAVTTQQYNLIQAAGVNPSDYGLGGLTTRFQPYCELAPDLCRGRFYTNGGYYFELPPLTDTNVSLGDETDIFGRRKAAADWNFSEKSELSYVAMSDLLEQSLAALGGNSSVTRQPWSVVSPTLGFNGHHIGTTRMSSQPEDGVVDGDLLIHGLDNMYVAGSSTFPSAGLSNPTLTIIALSIRLAAHLGRRLGGSLPGSLGDGLVDTD